MGIPKAIRKEPANEVVVFEKRVKRALPNENNSFIKNKSSQESNKTREESEKLEAISLKQAKFDVFKFGIKGFDKKKQESAKIQLAIKLGAKPPKNEFINYKELLAKKQEEREHHEQLVKDNRQFEAKILKTQKTIINPKKRKSANSIRKAKISKGHVGGIKGHIGSFSNGVLKLKKRDIFKK